MILAFSGSREITNRPLIEQIVAEFPWKSQITEIVHGGCRGVDRIVHGICEGVWPVKVFPADWQKHGNGAGPIRNKEMAEYCDAGIAIMIEDGSRGTKSFINQMNKLGKPLAIYRVPREKAKG